MSRSVRGGEEAGRYPGAHGQGPGCSGAGADPLPGTHAVDHFLCYQVKVQRKLADGTKLPKFAKGTQVDVADQFQTRRYDLKKITKLCNPVAKTGDPTFLSGPDKGANAPITPATIGSPDQHLVCYQAKLAKKTIAQNGCGAVDPKDKGTKIKPKQAKHAKRIGVYIGNQFGGLQIDTRKEIELCIPSQKLVVTPTPTPTPTTTPSASATGTATAGASTPTVTATGGPTPTSTATPGSGACPTTLNIAGRPRLDLDIGFGGGGGHDIGGPFLQQLRLTVSGCAGSGEPSCGVCAVGGPVPTVPLSNRRCAGDTSVTCAVDSDSDCGAQCECKFYIGPPFPVATGAALCVTPKLSGPVTGSIDVEAGALDLALPMSFVVGLGVLIEQPCPVCEGDLIVPLSTGGDTRVLTAASPSCTGVPGVRCFCHTCDHADQASCFEDADCPLTGACKGGGHNNEFCLDLSDCPDQGAGTFCGGTGAIAAGGSQSTMTPVLGGVFCMPPTGNGIINAAFSLPGPSRIMLPVTTSLQ